MLFTKGATQFRVAAAPCPVRGTSRRSIFLRRKAQALAICLPSFLLGAMVASAWALGQQVRAHETSKQNPFSELRDKTILVISPEPGIEVACSGGTLGLLSGHGNRLVVVYLTAGEKRTLDPDVPPEMLSAIRHQEATAAFKTLGSRDAQLAWLNYGQGELDSTPPGRVRERLTEIIRKRRPDLVFSPDPLTAYARYQEPDHRATALLGADAIRAAVWPLEYPKAGPAFKDPEVYYFYPTEPELKLDISALYERKLASATSVAVCSRLQPHFSWHYRSASRAVGRSRTRASLDGLGHGGGFSPALGATDPLEPGHYRVALRFTRKTSSPFENSRAVGRCHSYCCEYLIVAKSKPVPPPVLHPVT